MGLRDVVNGLLRSGDRPGLREVVVREPRAIRHLMGRLWDTDAEVRFHAAEAIGDLAAAHPDIGRDVLRRMMWSLTDEAATNGVFVVPVLAAVAARDGALAAPFVAPVASLLWDRGLRPAIVDALERIRTEAPQLTEHVRDVVLAHLDPADPAERACLARILGSNWESSDDA